MYIEKVYVYYYIM